MDGYDKFRNYGIEIYGAINAYSRRIIWLYVSNSNRTQVSMVRQFLLAVETVGVCLKFIRIDRGKETPILADAQYSFYTKHRRA